MRSIIILTAALAISTLIAAPALAQDDVRGLVIYNCSRCHAADQYYLAERSEKAWELLVKRMQGYYYGDDAFSDDEAARMVKYLAANPYNDADYKPRAPQPVVVDPAIGAVTTLPTSAPTTRPATADELAARARIAAATVSPAKATGLAKVMGYIAVGALVLMIATGLMRRSIGTLFRKTHGVLAFTFCGALTVHAAVFLAEYGAPGVAWLWCGIIATIILLSSEFTGLLHLKNRKLFVKFHITAGVVGLVLTAAHWVWIYV